METFDIFSVNNQIIKFLLDIDYYPINEQLNKENLYNSLFSIKSIINNYNIINHFIEYYKLYFYLNKLENNDLPKTKEKVYNILVLFYMCTSNEKIKSELSKYIDIKNIMTFDDFLKLSPEQQHNILNKHLLFNYVMLYNLDYFIYCFYDYEDDDNFKNNKIINPYSLISNEIINGIINFHTYFIEIEVANIYYNYKKDFYLQYNKINLDNFLKISEDEVNKLKKYIYVSKNYISSDESDVE